MRMASLVFLGAALGLALVAGPVAWAEDKGEKTHEGKVVQAGEGKLTMTDKDGNKSHTHLVPATAKISCDGKECRLEDLKPGSFIKVTTVGEGGKAVTRIEAKTQDKN